MSPAFDPLVREGVSCPIEWWEPDELVVESWGGGTLYRSPIRRPPRPLPGDGTMTTDDRDRFVDPVGAGPGAELMWPMTRAGAWLRAAYLHYGSRVPDNATAWDLIAAAGQG